MQELAQELEQLQEKLEPLEQQRREIIQHAEERTNMMTWVGLGLMSVSSAEDCTRDWTETSVQVQFGILARLTWWEYSWDIMEPVTYFVTYGTAMAGYAYFVLTRQEFLYPDATDRQRLVGFHKKAKKHRWDVEEYNRIKQVRSPTSGRPSILLSTFSPHLRHSTVQGIAALEADLRTVRDPLQLHLPSPRQPQQDTSKAGAAGFFGGISNIRNVISKLQ